MGLRNPVMNSSFSTKKFRQTFEKFKVSLKKDMALMICCYLEYQNNTIKQSSYVTY